MAGELLLAADTYIWGLQGICQLHRIPFAAHLVAQQFPPPHSVLSLQRAAAVLGLKCGLRAATIADLPAFPVPFIAILEPAEADAKPDEEERKVARLAIVTKCEGGSITYFEEGRQNRAVASLDSFAAQFSGQVMLSVPAVPGLKTDDLGAARPTEFGFRWFIPELLRHRSIWRDVLLASLAIQLMGLATPVFTQIVIDKVIVHQTISTLAVIGIALGVFIIFTAVMTWVRQYLVLHTGNRIDAVLGLQVFEHLFRLPPRYFEHRPTGVLVARVHGVETVVAPGTILLTLVPHDEPLVAEAWVSNVDAGFVQLDQKARIKLVAYPFQKFGMLDGMVRQISADSQEKDASNPALKPAQEATYRALITLEKGYLERQGQRLKLVPGMLINAEIHLGTRSVLEYLLSPVQKVAHEAGRER